MRRNCLWGFLSDFSGWYTGVLLSSRHCAFLALHGVHEHGYIRNVAPYSHQYRSLLSSRQSTV
ncbi:MAG: hypothetical protein QXJ97_13490 [Desulfurococcaceae archaeon]